MGITFKEDISRRKFLRDLVVIGASAAAVRSADKALAATLPPNQLPTIKLGTLEVIEKLDKPVVAYKVLGAGRIMPNDALPDIFTRLKPKDGICVGVFPNKRNEIAENCSLTRELSRTLA